MSDNTPLQVERIETTGQRLIERTDREIAFLRNIVADDGAVAKMERIGFAVRGPDGESRWIKRDIRTLVQERIRSLEASRAKLEPHADRSFTVESGKDIHAVLRDKKLRHTLSKSADLVPVELPGSTKEVPFMFSENKWEQGKPIHIMGDHLASHLQNEADTMRTSYGSRHVPPELQQQVRHLEECSKKLKGFENHIFTITKQKALSAEFLKQLDRMKLDRVKAPTRGMER